MNKDENKGTTIDELMKMAMSLQRDDTGGLFQILMKLMQRSNDQELNMRNAILQTQIDQLREEINSAKEKSYDFIGRLTNTMYIKIPANIVELYGLNAEDLLEVKIKRKKVSKDMKVLYEDAIKNNEGRKKMADNYMEIQKLRSERMLLEEEEKIANVKERLKVIKG